MSAWSHHQQCNTGKSIRQRNRHGFCYIHTLRHVKNNLVRDALRATIQDIASTIDEITNAALLSIFDLLLVYYTSLARF